MKIAFLGSPTPAATILERLVTDGHSVGQVITRPDRRRGRGGVRTGTPVAMKANELGIETTYRLDDLRIDECDLAVVVAYGKIIPSSLLERRDMLNVHFSLLPRWRGAAPVERAILAGDVETGVCVMGVEPTLDTGPVYAEERVSVGSATSSELLGVLADRGAEALSAVLSQWPDVTPTPQSGEPTYAEKLTAGDFVIAPEMSSIDIARRVRLERSRVVIGPTEARIVRATTSEVKMAPGSVEYSTGLYLGAVDGSLVIEQIQPAGGRVMSAEEWWRGAQRHAPMAWKGINPT
jgi:methionyl-tRNA formyltransferase